MSNGSVKSCLILSITNDKPCEGTLNISILMLSVTLELLIDWLLINYGLDTVEATMKLDSIKYFF